MEWLTLAAVFVLAAVGAWTFEVRARLDSLAVVHSGVALAVAGSIVPIFGASLVRRALSDSVAAQPPYALAASVAALSLLAGPWLMVAAFWSRSHEGPRRSSIVLHLLHLGLWMALTAFATTLALEV